MSLQHFALHEISHRYLQAVSLSTPEKAALIFACVVAFVLFLLAPVLFCYLRLPLNELEVPAASDSLQTVEEVKEAREKYIEQKRDVLKAMLSSVEIVLSSDNFKEDMLEDIDPVEYGASDSWKENLNQTFTVINASAAERCALIPPINEIHSNDSKNCTIKLNKAVSIAVEIPETGMNLNLERRRVPNECAICLEEYSVGSKLVWSSNPQCQHAFHSDCLMNWLLFERGSPICPCCRQKFVDFNENDFEDHF
jgi:uncharacterized protein YnzC (UPF0291/DUF896 family)